MNHNEFIQSAPKRQRYWARSVAAYRKTSEAVPNLTHRIIAAVEKEWQAAGRDGHLITQNVDGLHARAGSSSVLEIHGTVHRVGCLQCGLDICRAELQRAFEQTNVAWLKRHGLSSREALASQRPDGDTDIQEGAYDTFRMPAPCLRPPSKWSSLEQSPSGAIIRAAVRARKEAYRPGAPAAGARSPSYHHADAFGPKMSSARDKRLGCSFELMPRLVFHGGSLPRSLTEQSMHLASSCDGMAVLGTTLSTFSALRLVRAASEAGAKIVIVNHGETRGDDFADAVIDGEVAAVLHAAVQKRNGEEWIRQRLDALPPPLPSAVEAMEA